LALRNRTTISLFILKVTAGMPGGGSGVIAIGRDWYTGGIRHRSRLTVGKQRRTQHFIAQILLREDQCPLPGKEGIGSSMVRMNMRVNQNLEGRVGE
jgi:hypothetical protein